MTIWIKTTITGILEKWLLEHHNKNLGDLENS